ncbi:MAG: hypothetical protein F6K42_21385 [Leptolyngbya sp. SIO1D8]|nr:hypothetical protein [Leptolyngbya sp. SIO1D8]
MPVPAPLGDITKDFLIDSLIAPISPTTRGQAVGLLTLPDGNLTFTEEMNNRIYRVQFIRTVQ